MAIYQCSGCGYRYDEEKGDSYEGYSAGTTFAQLPEEFVCPDCSVCNKDDFEVAD